MQWKFHQKLFTTGSAQVFEQLDILQYEFRPTVGTVEA